MFDSDENFVEVGTALEPLEEEEVPKKKPVNISDQIVTDENGRRRFHGAFTGGFSAGYYNTVGSKEGWEPATYKSTRSDRFSRKDQNIQDFMDDEDLGAFGIAPQLLRTTGDFDKKESRKRSKPVQSDGPIPGEPVLEMIIKPVRDTVGMRILQRMGWKPGQGVGPRTYKSQPIKTKRKGEQQSDSQDDLYADALPEDATIESVDLTSKVYGCSLPPGVIQKGSEDDDSEESEESEDDNFDTSVLFAPEDLESPLCNPKEDTYGLGYKGLDRKALAFGHGHIDLFGGSELKFRVENKKLNIRGEAFGIGAFEDEDEEVYSREDISQYDFALETNEERKSRLAKEKLMKNKKAESDAGIPGFIKAKQPPTRKKYFAAPSLPKDFDPVHIKRKSRFEEAPEPEDSQFRKQGLDRHKLTLEERQVLIGEAKERISSDKLGIDADSNESNALNNELQIQKAQEKSERLNKFAEVLQAFSSNKVDQVDSSGRPAFKPFMKNPEKQDRYEKYMTLLAAGYKESLKDLQPLDMTEWQREREKMEFERASALYKPISEVMSSRFVSAQSHDISHVVPIKEVEKAKDPNQDPKMAAQMGLFGKLTHQIFEWHPDRLLCKRLNVPHPYPESKMVGVRHAAAASTTTSQLVSSSVSSTAEDPPSIAPLAPAIKKSLFDNLDFSKPPPGLFPAPEVSLEPPPPGTEDDMKLSETRVFSRPTTASEVSDELPIPTLISRPPIDLFKEIFADSSSESEDETPKPPVNPKNGNTTADSESNYKSFDNTSSTKTKGGNANGSKTETSSQIKYISHQKDSSNSEANPKLSSKSNTSHKSSAEIQKGTKNNLVKDEESEEEVYGPRPPTTQDFLQSKTAVSKSQSLSSSKLMRMDPPQNKLEEEGVEWVEKGKDSSSSKKSNKISSSNHHRHHKSKKSKEKQKSKHKSSKKHKRKSQSKHNNKSKSRDRSHSQSHKSKKDGDSNSSEDENSEDSCSSASAVQIHQSLSNKALLSKLKELTR